MTLPQGIGVAASLIAKEIERIKQLPLVVAIDGHSSSGKSTISKDLSKLLGFIHVDSGAMYRAVTLYCLNHEIDPGDTQAVSVALKDITIHFDLIDGHRHTFLNGVDVEDAIRTMQVSDCVSDIAAISEVRSFLVHQQRLMKGTMGIIMDGRDIGTVVFPDADIKLFVTATMESRINRRYEELIAKGVTTSIEEVGHNLKKRDHIDSSRSDSPLRQADDAIFFDTTSYDRSEQLQQAIAIIAKTTRAGQNV